MHLPFTVRFVPGSDGVFALRAGRDGPQHLEPEELVGAAVFARGERRFADII